MSTQWMTPLAEKVLPDVCVFSSEHLHVRTEDDHQSQCAAPISHYAQSHKKKKKKSPRENTVFCGIHSTANQLSIPNLFCFDFGICALQ